MKKKLKMATKKNIKNAKTAKQSTSKTNKEATKKTVKANPSKTPAKGNTPSKTSSNKKPQEKKNIVVEPTKETPKKNAVHPAKTQRANTRPSKEIVEEKPAKSGSDLDHKKELTEEFIEKGKRNNFLTYEEIIEFGDKNHLAEQETNDLLRTLEKENIELITQEELESSGTELDYEHEDRSATRGPSIKQN